MRGLEGVKQFMTVPYKSFPAFHATVEDMIAEGDKLWVSGKVTAHALMANCRERRARKSSTMRAPRVRNFIILKSLNSFSGDGA
jgi:predicted ester cyclase